MYSVFDQVRNVQPVQPELLLGVGSAWNEETSSLDSKSHEVVRGVGVGLERDAGVECGESGRGQSICRLPPTVVRKDSLGSLDSNSTITTTSSHCSSRRGSYGVGGSRPECFEDEEDGAGLASERQRAQEVFHVDCVSDADLHPDLWLVPSERSDDVTDYQKFRCMVSLERHPDFAKGSVKQRLEAHPDFARVPFQTLQPVPSVPLSRQTSVEGSDVLGFWHEVSKRSFDDSQLVKALSRVTGTTSVAGHSAPEQRSKKETSPTLLVSDSLDEEWWLGKPFFKTVRAFRFTTHGELHQVALAHCQSEWQLAVDGRILNRVSHSHHKERCQIVFQLVLLSGGRLDASISMTWSILKASWTFQLSVDGHLVPACWRPGLKRPMSVPPCQI